MVLFTILISTERGIYMNYKSTRSNDLKSSTFATLHGLANDGGLYIPENLPDVKLSYEELKNLSYQELSEKIIKLFFTEFSGEEIKTAVNSAYNNTTFTDESIVPLHKLNEKVSFGELFHGRTLAFKDLALSLFPYLLLLSKKKQNENKRKDCRIAILLFIGINFVKRGQLHLLHWSEEVVRLRMEEEQDWRFS